MPAGAVHERETCALPDVAVSPVGAPGTVMGRIGVADGIGGGVEVADAMIDGEPTPTALTALTRKLCLMPFASPVTVAVVPVLVPSENVLHKNALAALYCMA